MIVWTSVKDTYSRVPNNSAARLFIFPNFSLPTRLIWTFTLIKFQEKILPTLLLYTDTFIDFSLFLADWKYLETQKFTETEIYMKENSEVVKGVSSKPSGKLIVAPIFCF